MFDRLGMAWIGAVALILAGSSNVSAQAIEPGSIAGQNVALSIKHLRDTGQVASADHLQTMLNGGKIYIESGLDTPEYSPVWGTISLPPSYVTTTVVWTQRNFGPITSLAATLFHEEIHTHQYFPGTNAGELEAWTKTIDLQMSWLTAIDAGVTATGGHTTRSWSQINTIANQLAEKVDVLQKENNWYGASQVEMSNFTSMRATAQEWSQKATSAINRLEDTPQLTAPKQQASLPQFDSRGYLFLRDEKESLLFLGGNLGLLAQMDRAFGPPGPNGQQMIDPFFAAPGYWEKIGRWLDPGDLRGLTKPSAAVGITVSVPGTGVTVQARVDYTSLNPQRTNDSPVDDAPQAKGGLLTFLNQKISVTSHDPERFQLPWARRGFLASLLSRIRSNGAAGFSSRTEGLSFVRTPRGMALQIEPSLPRPIAAGAPSPNVKLFFVDLGQSSGTSVRMTVVNEGSQPVRILGDGFALEPVRGLSEQDVRREISRLKGRKPVSFDIDAYCLNMLKPAPRAGMVMRLAPLAVQATMGPVQKIAAATRALYERNEIVPDNDPVQYRHSLLQWTIWTHEQRFTEQRFTQAFVDHSKKNVEGAGRKWTRQIEDAIRSLAPGRWKTIQRVFEEAKLPIGEVRP